MVLIARDQKDDAEGFRRIAFDNRCCFLAGDNRQGDEELALQWTGLTICQSQPGTFGSELRFDELFNRGQLLKSG
jgi:hypothetical protein